MLHFRLQRTILVVSSILACFTSCGPASGAAEITPRTIFHAFNWRLNTVYHRMKHFKDMGYDAVQISPLQKSIGDQWWARYQPVNYDCIEGLGSENELRDLCRKANEIGIIIVADVVFNHMAVVASRDEWLHAMESPSKLEELKHRLDQRFHPLNRDDFHPWKDMLGDDWDNENRFEGWGAGEWSDLKPTERVLDTQKRHLSKLLECGVRGFRFDAAKHIRPNTMKVYTDHIRSIMSEAFVYFEVLSTDRGMHAMSTPIARTTDFTLCFALRDVVMKNHDTEQLKALPCIAPDSIRFVRNHDTIKNHDFAHSHGFPDGDPRCSLAWVILLAMDGGTVLVFPDDELFRIDRAHPVQAALRFRKEMERRRAPAHRTLLFNHTERSENSGLLAETQREVDNLMGDVEELERLAKQCSRQGVAQLLQSEAGRLRAKADGEQSGKKNKQHRHEGDDRLADGQLVMVTRGREGFILLNLARSWADVAAEKLVFEGSGLQGQYQELGYGFDIQVDERHCVREWGGCAARRVRVGPLTPLIFLRKDDGAPAPPPSLRSPTPTSSTPASPPRSPRSPGARRSRATSYMTI